MRRTILAGALVASLLSGAWAPSIFGLGPTAKPRGVADEGLVHEAGLSPSRAAPIFFDRVVILDWHTFLGTRTIPTDFSLAELGSQLDAILALGYRFVSLEDALLGNFKGPLNAVATIDDGHRTVRDAYFKVFAPRGIHPALMVYPAIIGNVEYALDPEQLRSLRDAGCAIGTHGYYHLFVNEELYRTNRSAFDKEVGYAKAKVEGLTELPAYIYAYPFGAFSEITKVEVAKAGFAFGLAVRLGFVYADPRLNDPYDIPRVVVRRDQWADIYSFLRRNAALGRSPTLMQSAAAKTEAKKTAPGQGG